MPKKYSERDLLKVLKTATTVKDAIRVARNIDSISEEIWTNVANEINNSFLHRRICIFELFRRHVKKGSTAGEISRLLSSPTWLLDEHIRELQDIGGRLPPVTLNGFDSVFAIDVLPGPSPVMDLWSVYIRMLNGVDRDAFSELLRGGAYIDSVASASVVEVGFLSP